MPQNTQPAPAPAVKAPAAPPPKPPAEFEEGSIATMDAAALKGVLTSARSTEFQKAKAAQRAGELASKELVPALAAMLGDEHLSVYARYGLEPIRDGSATDALVEALPKLKGDRLLGAVNSLGKRRDAKAVPALVKLMSSADEEVMRAAAAALGSIGGPAAGKELLAWMPKAKGLAQMTVADAALVCAERMLEAGQRAEAMAMYAAMTSTEVPQAARLGAMAAIIREETEVGRPR